MNAFWSDNDSVETIVHGNKYFGIWSVIYLRFIYKKIVYEIQCLVKKQ